MKKITLGEFFGYATIGMITLGVLIFLASHSLSFFKFTFTAQNQIYSWLGLLLTSGGAIGWLVVFETLAKTNLRRGIALTMMVVGILGEMATAVFDMQYSAQYGTGFQFKVEELNQMTMLVGILGALTGLALIMFFSGDNIIEAFTKDENKNGVPDWMEKKNKEQNQQQNQRPQQPSQQPQRQYASDAEELAQLQKRIEELAPKEQGKS